MAAYTITSNEAFNSLEISFTEKPAEAIREALKALKFRWHGVKKVWYGYADRETVEKALQGEQITAEATKATKPARFDKEALTAEYAKVWGGKDSHMTKYCVGKVAEVAELPSGEIIPIEKQGIETRFCFGESGYDYDDAARMAQHARTSESYFRKENMEHFNEWITDLESAKSIISGDHNNINNRYIALINLKTHTGQPADCKLRDIKIERVTTVLEWCGGSANIQELPGREFDTWGRGQIDCRVATVEEIEIILEAFKRAREAHEKKVNAYLKRYGLSKVDSWTYWREA